MDARERSEDGERDSPGGVDKALTSDEVDRLESHSAPRAILVHEVIRREGEDELARPARALLWSGLAAGLSMGFSMVAQGMLMAGLPEAAPWRPLVASFGYTLGFLIVILGRQQLFTESTLTAVLPVLYRRDRGTVVRLLRLWGIVLAANLAGTVAFAALLAAGGVFPPEAQKAFTTLGLHLVEGHFWPTTLRAVFAGWLIALMVWLLPAAGSARVLVIIILTYVVSLGSLSHVIAGSTEAAYAVLAGAAPVTHYLTGFLAPTLLGNTLGGVTLVALLNFAQVAPELEATSSGKPAG